MNDEIRDILEIVLDHFDSPCRLDHHGYCQEHLLQEADECIVPRIKKLLDK